MIQKVLFHIKNLASAVYFFIRTGITKKDKNTWIFGAWKGNSYSDNSRYLYEYVLKCHPEVNACWVTKNEEVYRYLSKLNRPVQLFPSKEAFRLIAKASYVIQTEGYKDTGEYPVGRARVIQLWHGTPCKAFNWFTHYNIIQRIMIRIETGNRRKFYWASTSRFYTRFFENVFNIPEERFVKCGYPRCDSFVVNAKSQLVLEMQKKGFSYVGLYLPTHRNWGADFDNCFVVNGLKTLDVELKKTEICLLFKPHPNEVALFSSNGIEFSNIYILNGNTVDDADIYQYLYKCDFLISDYSSVIYDYLIVDKPIILFPYDIDMYQKKDGGLIDEYFTKPVGPTVDTWNELADMIKHLLANDDWKEKRRIAHDYFNEYNTEYNCESLIEHLKNH